MTNFDHDDLPPDLADLGRRLRDERPVAEASALDRMTQRAQSDGPPAVRRAPRRTFAVSLATMLAMVSVTGVAAASLFGMSLSGIGKALTSSNQKIGTASSLALKTPTRTAPAPAAPSTRGTASLGSALGSIAGITPTRGGAASGAATGVTANLIPGNQANAGAFQYGPGRLVCRILRALGLTILARLLGCP